jgi:hypothetical protein
MSGFVGICSAIRSTSREVIMGTFFVRRYTMLVASLLAFVFMTSGLYAGQSTITDAEG